ncbi:MAG: DUF3467 domain-containing protein [Planctomycetes bacterium]|nr:DUF3467 domain-containing protein [Planctomycetota bacterium]
MTENANTPSEEEKNVEDQAREQTGRQQVRLRLDERNLKTSYANAFRANGTAEEVMLDFGLNMVNPATAAPDQSENTQPEIIFQVNERIILNYLSAKRLTLTLTQLIRRHEEQFGELELDVAKRRKDSI